MPQLTFKEYIKAIKKINKHYDKLTIKYVHQQESGSMLIALQHERNDQLNRITNLFHTTYK